MSTTWDRPPTPVHTLHTAYPIRRVQWRPKHDTELAIIPYSQPLSSVSVDPTIASIPQGLDAHQYQADDDAHIEVWDVRRHYIAKYAIETHDGAAIALNWSDEDTIVTAFQNGTFAQSSIKAQKTLPVETIPRNITAWNVRGEMAYAIDRFKAGEIPFDDLKPEFSSHWDKVGQKQKGIHDDPYQPLQAVGVMPPIEIAAEEDHLGYIADHYRLQGDSPERLCAWNSQIAAYCGRMDDARFWTFLRLFAEEFAAPTHVRLDGAIRDSPRGATIPIPTVPKAIHLERLDDALDVEELLSSSSSSSSSGSDTDRPPTVQKSRFIAFAPVDTRRINETQMSRASVASSHPASIRATPRALLAQAVSASRTQPSGSSHSNGYSDYPDPYGVVPTQGRSSRDHDYSGTYIAHKSDSSRQSPNTSTKPSPVINPVKGLTAPPKESIGPAVGEPSRESEYDKASWELYTKQRAETVLKWWRCYIDDVGKVADRANIREKYKWRRLFS